MILAEIVASLRLRPLKRGLTSRLFYICLLLGFIGIPLPAAAMPRTFPGLLWFCGAPFLEEFTWRTIIQNEVEKFFPPSTFPSPGNIITSLAFALLHFIVSPGLMAILTFFPSLVFGLLWTRFHSTWLCGILHLWYNLCLRL